MRKGFLAALAALLASQSLVLAQNWGPYQPGNPWQPMGPPPVAPTILRTWVPPGPVVRPPQFPNQPPQPAVIAPGMVGWPPPGSVPNPDQPGMLQMAADGSPLPSASPLPTVPEAHPAMPLAQPSPSAFTPPAPSLLNPPPANTTPLPPSAETYSMPADESYSPPHDAPLATAKPATGKVALPFGFWASAEYLMWWFQTGGVPALVSSGGTGALGSPGSHVLVDNLNFDDAFHSGGRFAAGYEFKSLPFLGLETSFLFLASRETAQTFSSPGFPSLARPVFNITTGLPDAVLVASPTLEGSVTVAARTSMWGNETNVAACIGCSEFLHLAALGGFRYLNLRDEVNVSDRFTIANEVPVFGGSTIGAMDRFTTTNDFYGGQLGVEGGFQLKKLTVDVRGTVAIGTMHERARIGGDTAVTSPEGTTTMLPGGVLALPTNSGSFDRNELAFIPELGINVGFQMTSHLKVFLGYSVLWIDNVARAGDQIDTTINPSQLPTPRGQGALNGAARPAFHFEGTDFWAQGINFGLELRY
jgi:hypothetical protein